MQPSLALYRAKINLYSSKLKIPEELIKISQREILSINSDNFKNITTRSISQHQSSSQEEDQLKSSNIFIENDLINKIRIKFETEYKRQNLTETKPKRHHSFSSYVNQRNNNKTHQKELKVFKSLSKNIKEMKVEKCKTQVVFHKNLRINNTQHLKKSRQHSLQNRPQKFPDFKGNLIVLGMKQKKMVKLKQEQQRLRIQSTNLPYIISAWNSKSSPPKKFSTVVMENVHKHSQSNLLSESSHEKDDDLVQFLKTSKLNLKKRKNFIMKKVSKSLIN